MTVGGNPFAIYKCETLTLTPSPATNPTRLHRPSSPRALSLSSPTRRHHSLASAPSTPSSPDPRPPLHPFSVLLRQDPRGPNSVGIIVGGLVLVSTTPLLQDRRPALLQDPATAPCPQDPAAAPSPQDPAVDAFVPKIRCRPASSSSSLRV
jgi:hypothetical protein